MQRYFVYRVPPQEEIYIPAKPARYVVYDEALDIEVAVEDTLQKAKEYIKIRSGQDSINRV